MFRPGPWEIGLIVLIVLIVFGVGKLPQVGGAVGKGLRAFRRGQSGSDEVAKDDIEVQTKTKKTARRKVGKG